MGHFTVRLGTGDDDFEAGCRMRADRVFHYFQDASEAHVNALGVGPEDIIKEGRIWVLTKMHVMFLGETPPNKKYICTTYPVNQKHVTFKRDYYINDADDGADPQKALITGASQWCIINNRSRRIEKTELSFEIDANEKDMIAGAFPKIHAKEPTFVCRHKVCSEDIDYNGHCNNTVYIVQAEKAAKEPIRKELYVNFASETRLGDEFGLFSEKQENGIFVEGRRKDASIVFQMLCR